jgi:ADP-ribose pyrophosphatase YjhB (NUDIX family)
MALGRFGAAAVIFDQHGRVLLVRHSYGRRNWEIPGGYGEPGESIVDAVVREAREETGLQIAVERLTGVYCEPDEDMHHYVFLGRAKKSQRPSPQPPEIP